MEKKLTAEQVAYIEDTLVLNGLKYDDIKLEVTDHIASEIEFLMEDNRLSFEENLKVVFNKWESQLKPTTYGLWLGYAYTGPKIVMDKMVDLTKTELKWGLPLAFFSALMIWLIYKTAYNTDFLVVFGRLLTTLVILVVLATIYFRISLFKSKAKTIYSTLFNRRFYITLLFSIQIGSIFRAVPLNRSMESKVLTLVLPVLFILYGINSLRFLYNHYKIERRLSISNS